MEPMARLNFSLRQMFLAVTFMSIVLGGLVWVAQHSPEILIYALLFSCSIGLVGLGVVALSIVMLFSVYTSDDTGERKLNIAKCFNLALIGALMILLPLLAAFGTFVLLPIMQAG